MLGKRGREKDSRTRQIETSRELQQNVDPSKGGTKREEKTHASRETREQRGERGEVKRDRRVETTEEGEERGTKREEG